MSAEREPHIKVQENGPYLVSGDVPLAKQTIEADADGECTHWGAGEPDHRHSRYALCRCGASKIKPNCDGTHAVVGFDGTETAENTEYRIAADAIEGPNTVLLDEVERCADARFCHRRRIWNLVKVAESPDDVDDVLQDAHKCPSGRYTAMDKETGELYDPELPKSIGIVEDPSLGLSGPLWVRGGIPVESASGETYEVRNRVTLCRCGASSIKPFCDGSHLEIGFVDGIEDE